MGSMVILVAVLIGLLSSIWKNGCSQDSPLNIQEESWIGCLSWILLYVGCLCSSCTRQPAARLPNAIENTNYGLWSKRLTIAGLSTAAVVAQFARNRGIMTPVTPIVTIATFLSVVATSAKHDVSHLLETAQIVRNQDFQQPSSLEKPVTSLQIPLRIPVNLLLALLLTGSGSHPSRIRSAAAVASVLFVAAQTITFTTILRLGRKSNTPIRAVHTLLDWDLLQRLSLSSTACFACLLVYTTSISTLSIPNLSIIAQAVAESASWISIFILCSEDHAATATTFETVATSFDMVTSNNGIFGLLTALSACIVALWQSVTGVPTSSKSRNWLYLLLTLPVWRLGHNVYDQLIESKYQRQMMSMHPVESIVQHARNQFTELVSSQSSNLEQARTEYVKRYRREPPKNFEKWFDLAIQHDFVLVDEFDSMMRAFEPFRGVAPLALQSLVKNAHEQSPGFVMKYEVIDERITITGGDELSWFAGSISRLLPAEWAVLLPNMTLAVNVFDEPVVCAPRDILDSVLRPSQPKDLSLGSSLKAMEPDLSHSPRFLNIGKQDAWEAITLSCPVNSPARNSFCTPSVPKTGLEFIHNVSKSRNVCEHCELQGLEGFFVAPENLHLTHSLAPIWSQGKPTSFNDIVFPSPYYLDRSGDYIEAEDPEWNDKTSQLYWVGAATGGHTTESNWKQMQRQRMVLMTQSESTKPIQLLHQTDKGVWRPYTSNVSEISSLFSTRVMGVTPQCESAACKVQKQAFGIGDQEFKDPASEAYRHKFALDLDGNSFSGRFYRLLQSKSMIIKQTVFEEWHDDRLVPWIHYVPVSTGFDELPELVRFLATTESGEDIAARIALESRDWAGKALRQIDLQLVWLRMLLEYGTIIDPDGDVQ